jgi:hypothetical protein
MGIEINIIGYWKGDSLTICFLFFFENLLFINSSGKVKPRLFLLPSRDISTSSVNELLATNKCSVKAKTFMCLLDWDLSNFVNKTS